MTKAFFYSTFSCDPYFNMTMDEWMYGRAAGTPGLVLLRLYTWNQGAITFGINQNEELAINRKMLGSTPLIRRITGGRALYHEPSELTYAIAVNTDGLGCEKLSGLGFESSQHIARALVGFLAKIGISAQYMRQSSSEFAAKQVFHTQACFQSKARHEIVSSAGKVVASAQRRIGQVFLQHGSIKINEQMPHPALTPGFTKSVAGRVIGALTEPKFKLYSNLFCESFEKLLRTEIKPCELNKQDTFELNEGRKNLKKLCLAKRDLIKQNSTEDCLYLKVAN